MKTKINLLTLATSLLICITPFISKAQSAAKSYTAQEAFDELKNESILLDVRDADEVAELPYDVENSINIPLSSLEENMNQIPKDKTVIIACKTGKRSLEAFNLLSSAGYENIAILDGGMEAWKNANLSTIANNATEVAGKKACCADAKGKKEAKKKTCTDSKTKKACCSKK